MALSQESSTSSLALSDIIHTNTLSPGPPTALRPRASEATRNVQSSPERSGSPEPLREEELDSYRTRIREMGLLSGASDMVSSREKELSEMVLRLIEAPRADSTQLERQATLISQLTAQRDFLTQFIADERARMESERDGWERAAEALIAQHQRSGKNIYHSRQDEYETRARLSALEGELYRLKPMLIMHPQPSYNTLAPNSSFLGALPYPSATGAVALKESRDKTAKKRKRNKEAKAARADEPSDGHTAPGIGTRDGPGIDSASQPPVPGPSSAASTSTIPQSKSSLFQDTQRSSAPSIYQHLLRKPSNQPDGSANTSNAQKSKRSKSPKRYTTITSDARSEHFLLAARRLGRERANVVSGLINAKTERDQEKHKQAKEEMERERQAAGFTGYYRNPQSIPSTGRKGKGKAPSTSTPARTGPVSYAIPDPTTPTPTTRGSPSTPKRASAGSLPSVQLFQHPGNTHAAYMFVPNTGIIGYPHMQTPPGAVRIPTVVGPMNQPSVTSTGSAHKPSVPPSPSPASISAPPPPAGKTQSSSPQVRESVQPRRQHRKNMEHDSSPNSLAAAINQSMDNNGSGGPSQVKTPLASLLSAAQSMMEQGGGAGSSKDKDLSNGKGGKRKASGTTSQPESPNSKRRRVNSSSSATAGGSARNSGKRVRSALDVLADQAAAHNQDDQAGTGKGSAKAKAKPAEADAPTDTEDALETKQGLPPARRSSRSNRGKRKEALANAAAPRMISPAISQRESTPRMIAPPDRQRNTPSSVTGLLPPPIITPTGPAAPAPPVLTKDDPADPLDVDQVRELVTPHVADNKGLLNGNEQERSPSEPVDGHQEDVPMVSPEVSQSRTPTIGHAKEPDAPSQTTENTTRRPLPKEPPIHTIPEPISKDKRTSDADGDTDADGDADPDVEMETKDPVVVIPSAAPSNKT
ncbi:hypothetical protein PQX77_011753 [Marasmius sp. AFHP31]|nr:hypothetical protein PQX77_011753 [Marasmius sp. AFHP31]